MKFELSVAFKYLIPRWRQLSVSIISLISILVVSLVVWLAIVFLSVSNGIQERWIDGFVSLNPPVKISPTDEYTNSYYNQIDRYSIDSNYEIKSIAEKLASSKTDPYDPDLDQELPHHLPPSEGKDLVKEAWQSVSSIDGARAQVAQVSLCNLKLRVGESFLSQLCYVQSHDAENERMKKRLVPPSLEELGTLISILPGSKAELLKQIDVESVETKDYDLPFFRPKSGEVQGCEITFSSGEKRLIIPSSVGDLDTLTNQMKRMGFATEKRSISFDHEAATLPCEITFDRKTKLSVQRLVDPDEGRFLFAGNIQGIEVSGESTLDHLTLASVTNVDGEGYWVCEKEGAVTIPQDHGLGDGVLLSSAYKEKGVSLGDRGYLSFMSTTSTAVQEQKSPVYVAGFFDPGIVPMAGKVLFVSPDLMRSFDGNLSLPDQMFSNGINVWLKNPMQAASVKKLIETDLKRRGLERYWKVESFYDFEFSKPILQQFDSDKTLFTLIAIMILIVACSNIISMLILLVNDKKREIGILQALGASPKRIGLIFGFCGLFTGLVSSFIGTLLAFITMKNLGGIVSALNFLKGHDFFQKMFFGGNLPTEVSLSSLLFVLLATLVISILAGLVPAVKAAQIRPSQTLRGEG